MYFSAVVDTTESISAEKGHLKIRKFQVWPLVFTTPCVRSFVGKLLELWKKILPVTCRLMNYLYATVTARPWMCVPKASASSSFWSNAEVTLAPATQLVYDYVRPLCVTCGNYKWNVYQGSAAKFPLTALPFPTNITILFRSCFKFFLHVFYI
jgi:hypothetical protein